MNDDIINILNLKHSDVQSCTSKRISNSLSYYITLPKHEVLCSSCQSLLKIKDYRIKKIKHQIIRDTDTTIFYRARRYYCPTCHTTHFEHNPFSSPNSNLSHQTIISILKFLKEPSSTFALASRLYKISNTKIVDLFDTYCQISKRPLTTAICIDEFYAIRSSKEKYVCMIIDFSTGTILDVMFGRTKNNWITYAQYLTDKERDTVRYISIDMYDTYRFAAKQYFKKATICVDSFHVIKNINQLLKNSRIKVMKSYDSDSIEYYLLKKFNWLLMYDSSKVPDKQAKYNKKLKRYINYSQLLEMMLAIHPTLKQAYELKEDYLIFNSTSTLDTAKENLAHMIQVYINSDLDSYRDFASTTLRKWFEEIVNSFSIVDGRRISNGPIEGINSRVKTILKVTNGFKNFSRMRNKIMYCLNKDALITIRKSLQVIKQKGKPRGKYKK